MKAKKIDLVIILFNKVRINIKVEIIINSKSSEFWRIHFSNNWHDSLSKRCVNFGFIKGVFVLCPVKEGFVDLSSRAADCWSECVVMITPCLGKSKSIWSEFLKEMFASKSNEFELFPIDVSSLVEEERFFDNLGESVECTKTRECNSSWFVIDRHNSFKKCIEDVIVCMSNSSFAERSTRTGVHGVFNMHMRSLDSLFDGLGSLDNGKTCREAHHLTKRFQEREFPDILSGAFGCEEMGLVAQIFTLSRKRCLLRWIHRLSMLFDKISCRLEEHDSIFTFQSAIRVPHL